MSHVEIQWNPRDVQRALKQGRAELPRGRNEKAARQRRPTTAMRLVQRIHRALKD